MTNREMLVRKIADFQAVNKPAPVITEWRAIGPGKYRFEGRYGADGWWLDADVFLSEESQQWEFERLAGNAAFEDWKLTEAFEQWVATL
jgi:hypothetical protein